MLRQMQSEILDSVFTYRHKNALKSGVIWQLLFSDILLLLRNECLFSCHPFYLEMMESICCQMTTVAMKRMHS